MATRSLESPWRDFQAVVVLFVAGFAGWGSPSSSRADILYATGFESPGFVANQTINGQGPFTTPGSEPSAFVITNSLPNTGQQALRAIGQNLKGIPGFVLGSARVGLNYDASATTQSLVVIEADLRLDGPSTDSGRGTADIFASVNLEATLSDSTYFSIQLSSNAAAHVYTTAYQFSAPALLGQYHRLTMRLDLAAGVGVYALDGMTLGALPFASPSFSRVLANVQFSMYALTSAVNPSNYNGRLDNLSVTAVPEPMSLALFGLGGSLALLIKARRRASVVFVKRQGPSPEAGCSEQATQG